MKVAMKGNAFLIYTLLSPNGEPRPYEIPSQYQEFKDAFEKRNANTLPQASKYTIAPLILWKECNLHLNPFIICRKTNL